MIEFCPIQCPYCWSTLELAVDPSAGDAEYVEDCQVCCQPIRLWLAVDVGGPRLLAAREND